MFKYIVLFALVGAVLAAGVQETAEVKSEKSDVRADGFDIELTLDNGVSQTASGDEHGNIKGSYAWVSPEGEHIEITYVADENGYQPQGAVLPTPPPIPEAIVKAIAYAAAHPSKEQ